MEASAFRKKQNWTEKILKPTRPPKPKQKLLQLKNYLRICKLHVKNLRRHPKPRGLTGEKIKP